MRVYLLRVKPFQRQAYTLATPLVCLATDMEGDKSEENLSLNYEPANPDVEEVSGPVPPPWPPVFNLTTTEERRAADREVSRLLLEEMQQMRHMMTQMVSAIYSLTEGKGSPHAETTTGDLTNRAALTQKTASMSGSSSRMSEPASSVSPMVFSATPTGAHQGESDVPNQVSANTSLATSHPVNQTSHSDVYRPLTTTQQRDPQSEGDWQREMLTEMRFSHQPMPKFSGGTWADYWSFKSDFKSHVSVEGVTASQKLKYLSAAYSGPAKQALNGCKAYKNPEEGYTKAWSLLEARHGNKRKYTQQLVKRVNSGPSVTLNDVKGLQLFVDDLSTCVSNLTVMGELMEVDTRHAITLISGRFKGKLRDDYLDESHKYEEENNKDRCGVQWLLSFAQNALRKAEKDEQDA